MEKRAFFRSPMGKETGGENVGTMEDLAKIHESSGRFLCSKMLTTRQISTLINAKDGVSFGFVSETGAYEIR